MRPFHFSFVVLYHEDFSVITLKTASKLPALLMQEKKKKIKVLFIAANAGF
jgi:hypothetical protein